MAIGDLLHKSFLFSAAKSLSALETSYTTIALYFGTLEARTPDEVICVPGKKGRNITVHVHMNDAAKRAKAEGHPCLTYVNLHGGGFILKRQGRDVGFIKHLLQSDILNSIPLIILDSDYPHAPDYPFPAAIEDIASLFAYIQARPDLYDTTRLLVGGFSAGGNIALGVSTLLGEEAIRSGKPHPLQGVVAFYPPMNFADHNTNPQILRPPHPVPGAIMPKQMGDLFNGCYFLTPDPDGDKRKPYASPIFADVATFPPRVLLVSCEYDKLRASEEDFRAKLKMDGRGKIDVRGRSIEGVAHGWDGMITKEGVPGWKERVEMYDEVANLVCDVAKI